MHNFFQRPSLERQLRGREKKFPSEQVSFSLLNGFYASLCLSVLPSLSLPPLSLCVCICVCLSLSLISLSHSVSRHTHSLTTLLLP